MNTTEVAHVHSPYWAKVWPAALGLCYFLYENPSYVQNKVVVEMAAGLGLPSIFAASYAKKIHVSDIEPEAIRYTSLSIEHNRLKNVDCHVVDWIKFNYDNTVNTILLSDVNYEPHQFQALQDMVLHYIKNDTTVILSTPQRLMAKQFIIPLLPYCTQSSEIPIDSDNAITDISIFVFRK